MKVNVTRTEIAIKENFEVFKLKDDTSSKLEFISDIIGYRVKYANDEVGIYTTSNPDQMILEFLEKLANYNNGDEQSVKDRLEHLVEKRSPILYQQYQTTYKNNELKYVLGLEDNLIRAACIEQRLTYQQLADIIGVSESSLRSSVSTGKVSKQVEKSIKMYLRISQLEKELDESRAIKATLKSWLS
jgi:hypothetical protein